MSYLFRCHRRLRHLLLLFSLALVAIVIPSPRAKAAGVHFGRTATTRTTSPGKKGYFDGKDYQLSLYISPFFGYESNYRYTAKEMQGSSFWTANGGAELRYRPNKKTYLRGEVSASVLMPLKDTSLTGFLFEIPVVFSYAFSPSWELFLSNHVAAERDRSPPVFFDTSISNATATGTNAILYLTVYDQLRPAVAFHPLEGLTLDTGPYFRVKQVNFAQNPAGADPDYRLFDLGVDFAASYRFLDHFQVRLHYDFAFRIYQNVKARPPESSPELDRALRALRHYVDLRLRFTSRLFGAFAGYGFRLNGDNGGSLEYREHHLFGGLSFDYKGRFGVSGQIFAALRTYQSRTLCEASKEDPTGGCKEADPAANSTPQNSRETLLGVRAEAFFTLTDWLSLNVLWELEDSGAYHDVPIAGIPPAEDPQGANHRVMAGASLSF